MSAGTRQAYGMFFSGPSDSGGAKPPMIDIFANGVGGFISDLSQYQSQGVRAILKFVGAPSNYQASDLSFVLGLWKGMMDSAAAKTSAQQMGNFVKAGTLLGNEIMDDCETGSSVYGGKPPTRDDLDEMARYSKSLWSLVPTTVRVHNQFLKAKSNWTYLDYGWAQWHRRFGNIQTWFTNNVNDGRSVGLGTLLGFNLLDGGSGLTSPWNQHPNKPNSFGMSPQELLAVAEGLSNNTFALGVMGWAASQNFDSGNYYDIPDIQVGLLAIANAAIGRKQGPINWRDGSPSGSTDTGSGSTQTVGGSWAVVDAGTTRRYANNAVTISMPVGVVNSGNLQCMLVHSRDSIRTIAQPSTWSEARRVSGKSNQGGELVLFYRIAGSAEVDETIALNGAGATGNSITARRFAFSGSSAGQGQVLATAGSGRTWTSHTSMGPVAGLTSAISDALVLICAARCNDFGGGSVEENVMSATTGTESWNRLFSAGNEAADDAGFFVDWAATSGTPSITSKWWSQTSGTQAGAGVGFMVAFAPRSIVAGTPPAFTTSIEDVNLSVGSNLSFTLTSAGSTPISYSKDSGPSNVTLGSVAGDFQFTPTSTGTYVINLAATNSYGSDQAGFRVYASVGANTAPSITNPGNKTIAAHDLLSFVVASTDAEGDRVQYTLDSGAPTGAYLDPETGQFVWIPSGRQGPGVYPIVVVASDGRAESRSTFTVTVNDTPWTRVGGPATQFGRIDDVGNSFRRI